MSKALYEEIQLRQLQNELKHLGYSWDFAQASWVNISTGDKLTKSEAFIKARDSIYVGYEESLEEPEVYKNEKEHAIEQLKLSREQNKIDYINTIYVAEPDSDLLLLQSTINDLIRVINVLVSERDLLTKILQEESSSNDPISIPAGSVNAEDLVGLKGKRVIVKEKHNDLYNDLINKPEKD